MIPDSFSILVSEQAIANAGFPRPDTTRGFAVKVGPVPSPFPGCRGHSHC